MASIILITFSMRGWFFAIKAEIGLFGGLQSSMQEPFGFSKMVEMPTQLTFIFFN